jgi:hypothetical protein
VRSGRIHGQGRGDLELRGFLTGLRKSGRIDEDRERGERSGGWCVER